MKLDRAAHLWGRLHEPASVGGVGPLDFEIPLRSETDGGMVRYFVEHVPAINPQLTAVLGDCLHNYRSALDHLVAVLRRIEGHPDDNSSQWPVVTNASNWARTADRQLGGVATVGRDAIQNLQPFGGWDLAQTLRSLSELDNTDKHRRLTVAAWTPSTLGTVAVPSTDLRWHHGEVITGALQVEHPIQTKPADVSATAKISLIELGQHAGIRLLIWDVDFVVRTAITTVIRAYSSTLQEPLLGALAPSGYQQGRIPAA